MSIESFSTLPSQDLEALEIYTSDTEKHSRRSRTSYLSAKSSQEDNFKVPVTLLSLEFADRTASPLSVNATQHKWQIDHLCF
jgi:hypothetical protein